VLQRRRRRRKRESATSSPSAQRQELELRRGPAGGVSGAGSGRAGVEVERALDVRRQAAT
jgi:predicted ThiF/HesA family dinucleotide-utilizing enzyme